MLIALVCVSVVAALKKEILQRSRNALSWLQILQLNNRSWKGRLADAEVAELKADRMEDKGRTALSPCTGHSGWAAARGQCRF